MRIAYNNLLDAVDVYDVSSANSNFPETNVQNQILTTVWQTLDTNVSDQYITFDAGAGNTFTCTSCFISGHNLSSGATVRFQMNATDAWGAPSVNELLTYRATHLYKYFTSSAYRFIRFYFDDDANVDGYIEVGRLFAGTYLQVNHSSDLPFKITNHRNDNFIVTDGGALYGTIGTSRRIFQYEFSGLSDTMIESLRTFNSTVGKFKNFYLMNYDELFTHLDICYGHLTNDIQETIIGNKRSNISLEIEETS